MGGARLGGGNGTGCTGIAFGGGGGGGGKGVLELERPGWEKCIGVVALGIAFTFGGASAPTPFCPFIPFASPLFPFPSPFPSPFTSSFPRPLPLDLLRPACFTTRGFAVNLQVGCRVKSNCTSAASNLEYICRKLPTGWPSPHRWEREPVARTYYQARTTNLQSSETNMSKKNWSQNARTLDKTQKIWMSCGAGSPRSCMYCWISCSKQKWFSHKNIYIYIYI